MPWPNDVTSAINGITYTRNKDGYYEAPGKDSLSPQTAQAMHDQLVANDPKAKVYNPETNPSNYLGASGYDYVSGNGDFAIWKNRETGKLLSQESAVRLAQAAETAKPAAAAAGPAPVNGTTTVRQDGSVYYTPPFGGQSVLVGQMPADLPNLAFQPQADGDLVGINPQTGAVVTRIAGFAYKQFSPQEVRAQVVSDLANSQRFTASEAAANRTFTGGENAANRAATAAEAAANRAFTGSEAATGRAFTSAENALTAGNAADAASIARAYDVYKTQGSQNFTAGESAIGRALSSGQFAATNALDLADRAAAAKRDTLAAAKTYTELSASPDLTGFQRFMQAGGGNIANAVLGRNDSLTDVGQLGAAQALRVSRAPYVAPAAYANPYANFDFQDTSYRNQPAFVAPTFAPRFSTFVEPPLPTAAPAYVAPKVAAPPVGGSPYYVGGVQQESSPFGVSPTGSWNSSTPAQYAAMEAVAARSPSTGPTAAQLWASQGGAGTATAGTNVPLPSGLAYGTGPGAMPIYRSAVATPPMGGGMDTVTGRYAYGSLGTMGAPRYALGNPMMDGGMSPFGDMGQPATGTFITGDSTDPMDPAAGGAQPEMVTLNDPEGNATADVIPMTQPGVGPDGGEASVGALLMAISKFLMAEEAKSAVAMPPPPMMGPELGMMGMPRQAYGALGMPRYNMGAYGSYNMGMPRYATGTMPGYEISAEDQPYVNEVLATRRATPYDANPFAANYQMQSPTARAVGQSAFQTATGVPGTELDYISRMYEPQGLARQSTYNQELQLGI